MDILISIKTKYVNKIFNGEKTFEFRKYFSTSLKGSRAIIYSSGLERAIVGEFTIGNIIYDSIDNLWKKFGSKSGITKEEFLNYFGKKRYGFAIEIKNITRYPIPLHLRDIRVKLNDPRWMPPINYAILRGDNPLLRLLDAYKKMNSSSSYV